MTGDESLFQELDRKKSENILFGDNSKGVIRGIGTIGNNSHTQIKYVLLIENLTYNLLSISQLCNKGYKVFFKQMHAMSSIQTSIKSFTLEKGMKTCMSFILMKLCLILNHV